MKKTHNRASERVFGERPARSSAALAGLVLVCLVLVCLALTSCVLLAPPEVDIAVFSDPHLYDPGLGTTGADFQSYVAQDRKLIAESSAILDSLVASLKAEKADVVFVAGDLTKDGERHNHLLMARKLAELERCGKKVYVVPGNHDVNNPESFGYSEEGRFPVPSVSPQEFARIYKDFGFGEALSRDPASLSYAAMPVYGLLVLALDTCRYENNTGHSQTGGALKQETMAWVRTAAQKANRYNFTVVAIMHHGVAEHFQGQKTLFSDYVLDGWEDTARELAGLGVRLVFTGHFHAQDIVRFAIEDPLEQAANKAIDTKNLLFDVETGSTVTSPCPYRLVHLGSDGTARIAAKRIEEIDYDTGGLSFQEYAEKYLFDGMSATSWDTSVTPAVLRGMIPDMLVQLGFPQAALPLLVPPAGTDNYVRLIASCFVSHYKGDETLTPESMAKIASLVTLLNTIDPSRRLEPLGMSLYALLSDPAPADNEVTIDLFTGDIIEEGTD